jgi:hypothetical protein
VRKTRPPDKNRAQGAEEETVASYAKITLSMAQVMVIKDRMIEDYSTEMVTIEETNMGNTVAVSQEGKRDYLVSITGATYDV